MGEYGRSFYESLPAREPNSQDVLVDYGRYTYVTKPERFAYRGTAAHNTIQVDCKEIDEWSHSWYTRTVSAQSRQCFVERGAEELAEGLKYMAIRLIWWSRRTQGWQHRLHCTE